MITISNISLLQWRKINIFASVFIKIIIIMRWGGFPSTFGKSYEVGWVSFNFREKHSQDRDSYT